MRDHVTCDGQKGVCVMCVRTQTDEIKVETRHAGVLMGCRGSRGIEHRGRGE